jgi:hypothetical protein
LSARVLGTSLVLESSADGSTWTDVTSISQLKLTNSSIPPTSSISAIGLAARPSGSTSVLVLERDVNEWDEPKLRLWVNNGSWTNITNSLDLGFFPSLNGPWRSIRPRIEWDGSRFLLLSPKGRLFTSTNATSWTQLPALPGDSAGYVQTNFWEYGSLGTNNLIWSFASGNGTIVARPCKVDGYTNVVRA